MTTPMPWPIAVDLLNHAYLDQRASDEDLADASDWCTRPIGIGGRRARYSLLTRQDDELGINDYVQDHDRRQDPPPVPDPTWAAALANASDAESLWNVSIAAYSAGQEAIAVKAMRIVADAGHPGAMFNLGVLLQTRTRREARRWFEQAAEAGQLGGDEQPRCAARRPGPGRSPPLVRAGRRRPVTPRRCSTSACCSKTGTRPQPAAGLSGPPRPGTPAR